MNYTVTGIFLATLLFSACGEKTNTLEKNNDTAKKDTVVKTETGGYDSTLAAET